MSIYIGDNADCLTEGRLSSVCSCAPCLPYVWPSVSALPMSDLAHVWPADTVTLSLSNNTRLCLNIG